MKFYLAKFANEQKKSSGPKVEAHINNSHESTVPIILMTYGNALEEVIRLRDRLTGLFRGEKYVLVEEIPLKDETVYQVLSDTDLKMFGNRKLAKSIR